MVKLMGLEVAAVVPPLPYIPVPGVAGLVTVTDAVPEVATAVAGMEAVTWFPLMNVVICAVPLKFTTAWEPKLLPSTVRTNVAPALALLGAS